MSQLSQRELDRCNALRATEPVYEDTLPQDGAALNVEIYALRELALPDHVFAVLSNAVATMWSTWKPGDMLVEVLLIDHPQFEDSDQVRMGFYHPGGIIVLGVAVPAIIPWAEWTPLLRLVVGAAHEMMHAILEKRGEATHESAPYAGQADERICWTESFDLVRTLHPDKWGALRDSAAQHEEHWIEVAERAWASESRAAVTQSRYIAALSALHSR